jgi:hypothetical protein
MNKRYQIERGIIEFSNPNRTEPVLNGPLDKMQASTSPTAAADIRKERPNTAIVLCSMYLDSQLATVARDVGITSVLSKSNIGQVIKGVDAGLRGESFAESEI